MKPKQIVTLIVARENPSSFAQSARTAVAAVASLLVARLLRLPEAYWASITALIVMQSTFGAALSISVQRFAGTAVGAVLGALAATYFHDNVISYGVLVFLIGLICAALKIERTAYRYASITLAIIMLIPRVIGPWTTAAHRFVEVSIGIVVGLAIAAMWPERQTVTKTVTAKAG
jgi:uncharacterized membrane protein YgaE (UPF0421/DUF939 family)